MFVVHAGGCWLMENSRHASASVTNTIPAPMAAVTISRSAGSTGFGSGAGMTVVVVPVAGVLPVVPVGGVLPVGAGRVPPEGARPVPVTVPEIRPDAASSGRGEAGRALDGVAMNGRE
jgi:hypothetical protein